MDLDYNDPSLKYAQSDTMILSWLDNDPRAFSINQFAMNPEDRHLANRNCLKLVKEGYLERYGDRWGWFRLRQSELDVMDLDSEEARAGDVKIWLPLELSDQTKVFSGNLIIFFGSKDSGKSALSFNTAKENRHEWDVRFFNSETGAAELRNRLLFSDITIDMWQDGITFYRRAGQFDDAVRALKPHPGMLIIIDFFEIHTDYFAVGEALKNIHDSLNGAVCIVCMHKKHPGLDVPPLGSWRALEVCRVGLSIDHHAAKIKVGKNPQAGQYPWNKVARFELVDGFTITKFSGWHAEGDE